MSTDNAQTAVDVAREALRTAQTALRLAEEAAGFEPSSTAGEVELETLTVKQINVVEDDGRLRMIIGNSTHSRVAPMRGELRTHPGRAPAAGVLFVNDDGTECGGVQFLGWKGDDGRPTRQVGYMAFDDFEQNESFRMGLVHQGGVSERFIEPTDQPAWSLVDFVDEYEAAEGQDARDEVQRRYFGTGRSGASRLLITRDDRGAAAVILRDGQGRDRLRLVAPLDGDPDIQIIDPDGQERSLLRNAAL